MKKLIQKFKVWSQPSTDGKFTKADVVFYVIFVILGSALLSKIILENLI